MLSKIRRLLFGKPIATARQKHERLNNLIALPVFSSDAVSSVAYGPQEVLIPLIVLGSGAFAISLPIGIAISVLILIVAASYRQTVFAYPQGGGSFIVAKENLGDTFGLIAAAAVLTDYVLTVAVSMAAGIAAIVSAYPDLDSIRIWLCLVAVLVVMYANLRGLRESGAIFAPPTYVFVICLYVLVATGLAKLAFGHNPVPIIPDLDMHVKSAGLYMSSISAFLVLRAFSSGCSALTGIEAIADGVAAFRAPESKNAAKVMVAMALILTTLVIGITYLAFAYKAMPGDALKEHHLIGIPNYEHLKDQTLVSQLAEKVFGRNWFYMLIQFATMAILLLAANTAYQDFPRLSSILAKNRFAPRQLANIGDRLVFTNGIVILSALAGGLLVLYHGETTRLIPLYAVGVFISFTLSQAGMAVRQRKLKHAGWQAHSLLSAFGALVTGVVAVVTATTKFTHGAWMVLVLIAVLVLVFRAINKHYVTMGNQLRVDKPEEVIEVRSTAIVLVAGIHKGVMRALKYARTLSHDCRALHIEIDPSETPLVRERWEEFGMGVPLVILESPYRTITGPVLKYLEEVKKERPDHVVTVVLPEFVPAKWWQALLHNQSGLMLTIALMFRKDIVVTNVRYYLDK